MPAPINPDTVQLMALDEQLRNGILFMQAARANVQALLARKPPAIAESPVPVADAPARKASPKSLKLTMRRPKAAIRAEGIKLGIPGSVLDAPAMLNGTRRPSEAGCARAEALIATVKQDVAAGRDPARNWGTAA